LLADGIATAAVAVEADGGDATMRDDIVGVVVGVDGWSMLFITSKRDTRREMPLGDGSNVCGGGGNTS
jgi:hypothetical protein